MTSVTRQPKPGQTDPSQPDPSQPERADPPLSGCVVKLTDLTAAQVAAWSDLTTRAATPNPLFEPSCLLPARHLVNRNQIHLALAFSGSTMHGCFPFQVVERWGGFHRPVMTSQVRRMQYDGTPLLDRHRTVGAAQALLSGIQASSHELPGILVNDWVAADGPVAAAMQQAARNLGRTAYRYRDWVRPTIRRLDDGDYRRIQSANTKRHIRRSRQRMLKDWGQTLHAQDCTNDPGILQRVIELEAAGYKGREGIAIAQHPGESEWFIEMCERFRDQGRLHILALRRDHRHVAIQVLLRGDEGLFGLKLVYDEEFSKHGLGIPLVFDAMELLFSQTDAQWLDMCTYAGNEALLRLYPDRRPVVSLVTPVGGHLDRRRVDVVRVTRGVKSRWGSRAGA